MGGVNITQEEEKSRSGRFFSSRAYPHNACTFNLSKRLQIKPQNIRRMNWNLLPTAAAAQNKSWADKDGSGPAEGHREMSDEPIAEVFGCENCWPSSPEGADAAYRALTREADLIDESHFHVMIRACSSCSQRFLSIFTEMIDWVDGDDPQYWTLLPITEVEAADLIRQGNSFTEQTLNSLGSGRRSLHRDHPEGKAAAYLLGNGHLGRSARLRRCES